MRLWLKGEGEQGRRGMSRSDDFVRPFCMGAGHSREIQPRNKHISLNHQGLTSVSLPTIYILQTYNDTILN